MDNKDASSKSKKIIDLLANYLGVESSDIHGSDSLTNDLHMNPADITDFLETLSSNGIDTDNLDLGKIDLLDDLVDKLTMEDL